MDIAMGKNILFLIALEEYQGIILVQLTFFMCIKYVCSVSQTFYYVYYTSILELLWCLSSHLMNYFMNYYCDQWDSSNDECIFLFVEQVSTGFLTREWHC